MYKKMAVPPATLAQDINYADSTYSTFIVDRYDFRTTADLALNNTD